MSIVYQDTDPKCLRPGGHRAARRNKGFRIGAQRLGRPAAKFPHGRDLAEWPVAERGISAELLDDLPESLVALDHQGRIVYLNAAATRTFGRDQASLIGCDADRLLPASTLSSLAGRLPAGTAIRGGILNRSLIATGEVNETIRLDDGGDGEQSYQFRARLRHAVAGGKDWAVVTATALSALQRRIAELETAVRRSEEQAAVKAEFLANLSHELRTPLASIVGYTDSMLSGLLGLMCNPSLERYLTLIHHSGLHLMALTGDILDLARIDANKTELVEEEFALAQLFDDAVAIVQGQTEIGEVAVATKLDRPALRIRGDRIRLCQVLINLLSNAVKFTPPGGSVILSAGFEDCSGHLAVSVADTGIGIAAEDIERVLEPFGQAGGVYRRPNQGTGLGLPLSRKLVELHGGELILSSRLGRGTTVTVILPTARLLPDAPATGSAAVTAWQLPGGPPAGLREAARGSEA
ncbi:MAG: PAS domain-containing protein [Azospirillum sp.]|nr:PAS domain-containing protein [Azospirillum sp.]